MSNPLSGHTAAQGFTGGSGLRDGDGLNSPSLTNPYEALHGNGILRVADGGYGGTRNATGSSTEGHVAVGAGGSITVSGGYAVLDGVVYQFAGGFGGSHTTTTIGTSTNYVGTLPTPHATIDKEAYVVIYVAASGTSNNIMYEFGALADPATETPQVPSTFLSAPGPAANQKSTVLAVLLYTVSAGGTLTASLNTPTVHDRRTFIRPTPMYLNHLTAGSAGSVTSTDAVENTNEVRIDTIFSSPSDGDFNDSPFGGLWMTHSPDGHSVLLYSAQRDIGGTPTRETWRLSPNEVNVISTGSDQSFNFTGPNIWVITPSAAINLDPLNTFPHGHIIDVINKGSNNITFDSTGIAQIVAPGEGFRFVYTGSAWKEILVGTASPTVSSGVSGLIQLSDGAGAFTSDSTLSYDTAANELTVDGKLTVTGLIDPTGLELDPQATNPGGVADNTLWLDSGAANRPKIGSDAVMRAGDQVSELVNDVGYTDGAAAAAAAPVQSVNTATGAVVLDADDLADGTTNVMMTATERTKLSGIETGATADQTAAEIKTAYESNADTNAFTDADHTKLNGIETGATADQTGAEIKAAYEGEADTNAFTDAEKTKLSGIATGAEVNVNADWNAVSGDAQILNKPSDVTDLSTHSVTELSDVSNAGSGAIITSAERTKLSGIETAATADQDADEVPVAATPTNYTAATADVEAHLAGIDTALATAGGVSSVFGRTGAVVATSGDYDDGEITAAASATNYTPSAATVEGHLAGIDTALGSVGGGSGTVTSIATTAPITGGTITSTGTIGISAATTSAAGSMSAADKSKLDGIAAGATTTGSVAKLDCIVSDSAQTAGTWVTIDFAGGNWQVHDPDGILGLGLPAPDPTAGNITIGSSSSEMYLVIVHLWLISTANSTGNGLWIVRGNSTAAPQDGKFFYHREQEYVSGAQSAITTPIQFTVEGGTLIESIEYYFSQANFQYRGNPINTTRVSFLEFVRLR